LTKHDLNSATLLIKVLVTLLYLFICMHSHLFIAARQNCKVITNNYIVCVQTNITRNNRKYASFDQHKIWCEKYTLVVSFI
jgi:hypothetical protein